MTIATHAFPSAEQLEDRYRRSLDMIAQIQPLLELETSDERAGYRSLLTESRTCGTIASVLMNDGDATALRHMADAERFGRLLLTEAGKGLRMSEVEVIHGRRGPLSIVARDVPRAAEYPLAVHLFDALIMTMAFGDASACAAFATFPEAGYRSPNMVASESVYAVMRAFQAWLLGDARQALAMIEFVLGEKPVESVRAEMLTLRAIIARDEGAFRDSLHAFLTFHKSGAEKQPIDHRNMVAWPALALARLAKARGLPVADDGYLPARLLPDGPIRYHRVPPRSARQSALLFPFVDICRWLDAGGPRRRAHEEQRQQACEADED